MILLISATIKYIQMRQTDVQLNITFHSKRLARKWQASECRVCMHSCVERNVCVSPARMPDYRLMDRHSVAVDTNCG